MAKDLDPLKLSSPRIFLFRMMVFVILGGLVAFVLYKQIQVAFMANPGLNAVIIAVLFIGIVLSVRQVARSSVNQSPTQVLQRHQVGLMRSAHSFAAEAATGPASGRTTGISSE